MRAVGMIGGVSMGAMFYYTKILVHAQPMMHLLVPLMVLFVCSMVPDYMLGGKVTTRQTAIRKLLPDTLDLLVVSAEGRHGSGWCAGRGGAAQGRPPGGRVRSGPWLKSRLGRRRREAWQDMADRAGVEELSALVAGLYQARKLGVSIAKALRAHSDALRSKRSMKIREQAADTRHQDALPAHFFCIFPALVRHRHRTGRHGT